MPVDKHVDQLNGGRLRGFMVKSSCVLDEGFRALILQPSRQPGGGVTQAFWGVCFVMLAQGQFGRIACDSRQMTDVNLIQQGPKR